MESGSNPEQSRSDSGRDSNGSAQQRRWSLQPQLILDVYAPGQTGKPVGKLAEKIEDTFGSFTNFKAEFEKAGLSRFGSGYAWLSVKKDKQLVVHSTANQDSPLLEQMTPLLVVDVWEHAYYLKYQNRRAEYLANWWNLVNWEEAENRYHALK